MFDNYKKIFMSISLFIAVILISLIFYLNGTKNDDNIISYSDETTTSSINTSNEEFYVDIKGSIKKPGVYKAKTGMIVNDIIKLAGGLKKNAYINNINLSKEVTKEMVIYIYSKSEVKTTNSTTSIILNDVIYTTTEPIEYKSTTTNTSTYDIANTNLININKASKEELMTLSSVGSSKADKIIEYRNSTPFLTIEDIKNVSGIGDSIYEKIKDYITV